MGEQTQYIDAWLCLGRWVVGVGNGYSPQPCLPADLPLPEGKIAWQYEVTDVDLFGCGLKRAVVMKNEMAFLALSL